MAVTNVWNSLQSKFQNQELRILQDVWNERNKRKKMTPGPFDEAFRETPEVANWR